MQARKNDRGADHERHAPHLRRHPAVERDEPHEQDGLPRRRIRPHLGAAAEQDERLADGLDDRVADEEQEDVGRASAAPSGLRRDGHPRTRPGCDRAGWRCGSGTVQVVPRIRGLLGSGSKAAPMPPALNALPACETPQEPAWPARLRPVPRSPAARRAPGDGAATTPRACSLLQRPAPRMPSIRRSTSSAFCGRRAGSFSRHASTSASTSRRHRQLGALRRRQRRLLQVLQEHLHGGVGLEDQLPGEQVIGDAAEGIHVGAPRPRPLRQSARGP